MSIISRKFAACPARTAVETWESIVAVIAAEATDSIKQDFLSINGVIASIISDETTAKNAITVVGNGPRLRVYCLYGEASVGDDANEAGLSWKPFENDWVIYFPVEEIDHEWVTKLLSEKSKKFKTYKAGEKIAEEEDEEKRASTTGFTQLTINTQKL